MLELRWKQANKLSCPCWTPVHKFLDIADFSTCGWKSCVFVQCLEWKMRMDHAANISWIGAVYGTYFEWLFIFQCIMCWHYFSGLSWRDEIQCLENFSCAHQHCLVLETSFERKETVMFCIVAQTAKPGSWWYVFPSCQLLCYLGCGLKNEDKQSNYPSLTYVCTGTSLITCWECDHLH